MGGNKGLLAIGAASLVGAGYLAYKFGFEGKPDPVRTGDTIFCQFRWTNKSPYKIGPNFVLQIKGSGSGWIEGDWIVAPTIEPEANSDILEVAVQIPSDWDVNAEIEVELKGEVSGEEFRVKYWRYPFKIVE